MSLPPGTVPPAVRAPVAAPRQTLWRWVGGVHVVAVAALCVAAVVIGAERCEGFACMVAAAIWLAWAGASVLVMGVGALAWWRLRRGPWALLIAGALAVQALTALWLAAVWLASRAA